MGAENVIGWLVLAAIPLLIVACTAFTKVAVVLSALRVGLGAEALLPFAVILVLAILVSALVMAPVGIETAEVIAGLGGVESIPDAGTTGWLAIGAPLASFLDQHAASSEVEFFAGALDVAGSDPRALVPAFMVTELTEALTMTVLILVPFVVIDLLAAQVLALLDLTNLRASVVTLPLKILVFLAAGGFDLIIGSVVEAYA